MLLEIQVEILIIITIAVFDQFVQYDNTVAIILQKVPELKPVEESWKRFENKDWESIHFDVIKGTSTFRKKSAKKQ